MLPSHGVVARTLADLDGSDAVGRLPIVEALSYRRTQSRHAMEAWTPGRMALGSPPLSPGGRDTAREGGVDTFPVAVRGSASTVNDVHYRAAESTMPSASRSSSCSTD